MCYPCHRTLWRTFFTTIFNFNEFISVYVVNIRFICDGQIYLPTYLLTYFAIKICKNLIRLTGNWNLIMQGLMSISQLSPFNSNYVDFLDSKQNFQILSKNFMYCEVLFVFLVEDLGVIHIWRPLWRGGDKAKMRCYRTCAMTRHHAEPNINILFTRNLPFDSDVRQWGHSFMIPLHCLWAKSNNRTWRYYYSQLFWLEDTLIAMWFLIFSNLVNVIHKFLPCISILS